MKSTQSDCPNSDSETTGIGLGSVVIIKLPTEATHSVRMRATGDSHTLIAVSRYLTELSMILCTILTWI